MNKKEYSLEVGGKTIKAEFNDLADQAHGSVILRSGNTAVLATAVMSDNKKDGDYFPLTVEYEEKFYAAGKILGSRFIRREGRPSDEATLSGRVVDRTIRPLFDGRIRNEVQVVTTVLSIGEDDPDILAVNAASLAIATSNIPWDGPVSAVRIGKNKDLSDVPITPTGASSAEQTEEKVLIINPTYDDRKNGIFEMDLLACGKDGNINMIEVGSKEIPESFVIEALKSANTEIEKMQEWQKMIVKEIGKEKRKIEIKEVKQETTDLFEKEIEPELENAIFPGIPGKESIHKNWEKWSELVKTNLPDENYALAMAFYDEKVNELIHSGAIEKNKRADGREMDELRPLFAQAGGISESLHGSGVFYRGGTHVLSVLTLGGPGDSQLLGGIELSEKKRFMHHYNFPPFSVGETGRIGGFNRRMIGHGALAEKALLAVIPPETDFPYTIRLVSEALASNGSTSMASVCGSSIALMDGGVPIKNPVAGIAVGLMSRKNPAGKLDYKILTDIQGPEDHHGDMDLKVAGTKDGITAVQMDVKVDGISVLILEEAFEKAKNARKQILDVITKEISSPRKEISKYAPKILIIQIKGDQIGMVIGSGGKTVNEIRDLTGAEITIEDSGLVYVTGVGDSAEKAIKIIAEMTREYKAGEKFEGTVIKVLDFGAFVKIGYNTEGLVHISEIAPFRVERVSDYLKEGDTVPIIIKEIDDRERISLSIKQADPGFVKKT
ncbi:polyribonucleotide nucleotidyltransferase [Patescibacteria group bacterium]|nr:polyribonucleotide nucleotidyltransferase [Patescibacteria group bacterium]MBU4115564.1 polyribonucleotide nucleotidyltransferase [Patescibacteria group bacterium]